MIKKLLFVVSFLFFLTIAYCQDRYSSLFYNDFSALNPAYVGILKTNRANFYTSQFNYRDFKTSTGSTSIIIPLIKLYSGIGFHSTYSKFDVFSDLDFGFIYSFKYEINDNIKVSLGSNFSIYRNKVKGTLWIFDDDFLNEYPEHINKEVFLFNMDIGLWLNIYGFQIGLTNKHINEASKEMHIMNNYTKTYKLKSSLNTIINYDFDIGQKHTLSNSLLIYELKDFSESKNFVINNQFALYNKFIYGLTTEIIKSNGFKYYLSPNLGINLSDKFKFLMSVDLIKINSNSKGNTIEAVLNYNF